MHAMKVYGEVVV